MTPREARLLSSLKAISGRYKLLKRAWRTLNANRSEAADIEIGLFLRRSKCATRGCTGQPVVVTDDMEVLCSWCDGKRNKVTK